MRQKQCFHCGAAGVRLTETANGKYVCDNCLRRFYDRCMICRRYALKDEILANSGLCEECYDEEDD